MDKPYPKHVYHEKSNAGLSYIIGDANEARVACRTESYVNHEIEVKYLEQIAAASAILLWRYSREF